MNVKVRSHPGATTEDVVDYVKPIAPKKNGNVGYTYQSKWSTGWYQYHQVGEKSGTEHLRDWRQPRNSSSFLCCC